MRVLSRLFLQRHSTARSHTATSEQRLLRGTSYRVSAGARLTVVWVVASGFMASGVDRGDDHAAIPQGSTVATGRSALIIAGAFLQFRARLKEA